MDSAVQALVKRLETVTARLEAVEKQIASGASAGAASSSAASSAGSDHGASPSVAGYDELISSHIKPFVEVTQKVGNDELKAQVALLEKAINAQREFIVAASQCKKPDAAGLQKLVEPTSKLMQEIGALRDKQRANKQFNHLSTISEGVSCLGWVCVEPTPVPFVNEARGSSEFYSNKNLVEFKKTNDQPQLEWVSHWNTFMKELANYIKKFHTTGVVWNPRGGDASSFQGAPSVTPTKGPGGPPPPPAVAPPAASSAPAADTSALFAALNKGGAITTGLKKVTKEMKTKNQEKVSSLVPAEITPKKATTAPGTTQKKGTPKFELQGNKWVVEWQDGATIDITETEVRHTVYVYKSERTVVKIKGKVNAITVDGCKKTAIVFENAVASCEVVNSTGVEIQCTGRVPSMAVDKCTGVQLFLSKEGLETELVTSKSDSVNVLIPDPAGGLDPVEMAVPEQFKTVVVNGKLVTASVEHV